MSSSLKKAVSAAVATAPRSATPPKTFTIVYRRWKVSHPFSPLYSRSTSVLRIVAAAINEGNIKTRQSITVTNGIPYTQDYVTFQLTIGNLTQTISTPLTEDPPSPMNLRK